MKLLHPAIVLIASISPAILAGKKKKPSGPEPTQLEIKSAKFDPSESHGATIDCPAKKVFDGHTPLDYQDQQGNAEYLIRADDEKCEMSAISEIDDTLHIVLGHGVESVSFIEIWPSLAYKYWVQWYSYTTTHVEVCTNKNFKGGCVDCPRNKRSRPEGLEGQYLGMAFNCPEGTSGKYVKSWLTPKGHGSGSFRSIMGLTEVKVYGFGHGKKDPVETPTPPPTDPEDPVESPNKPPTYPDDPVESPNKPPTDDEVPKDIPKHKKYCDRRLKKGYCKFFEECHFKNKPTKLKCAKTCYDTLKYTSWPCENCGKRLKYKTHNDSAEVCRGGKKRQTCVSFREFSQFIGPCTYSNK